MRVLVAHPAVSPDAARDVADVLDQVDVVGEALRGLGHEVVEQAVTLDLGSLDVELSRGYDAVFNLVEELGGTGKLAPLVPILVRGRGVPCTGAGPAEMALCDDKLRAKQVLLGVGLPTPSFRLSDGSWVPARPEGAVIIKGRLEHASVGVEADSVRTFRTDEDLCRALEAAESSMGGKVLAEEYVHGREFNVALLPVAGELQALVPAEILFGAVPEGAVRVVGYKAKWDETSIEYASTPRRQDFGAEDGPLLDELRQLALRACEALGVRSYARVDFRVDGHGRPFILEVNTNPCLSPDAGFAAALVKAGISFEAAVAEMLVAAKLDLEAAPAALSPVLA